MGSLYASLWREESHSRLIFFLINCHQFTRTAIPIIETWKTKTTHTKIIFCYDEKKFTIFRLIGPLYPSLCREESRSRWHQTDDGVTLYLYLCPIVSPHHLAGVIWSFFLRAKMTDKTALSGGKYWRKKMLSIFFFSWQKIIFFCVVFVFHFSMIAVLVNSWHFLAAFWSR